MTFDTFKNLVPKIKKMSVPGESSHFIMAPEVRMRELYKIKIEEKNPRNAAVLMLFYPKDTITHLVLILRPTYEGVHSGQVALPGGKVEEYDINYEKTALRETWEEVGVKVDEVEVLKPLTKVYIPPSNFWVHPFLGVLENTPSFVIQEEEVAKVIEIPLSDLLNEDNVVSERLSTSYAKNILVPSFKLKGYTVWGATAMMLSELKVFLKTAIAS
ncbi:CoA pyrophosphatase [Aquimarina sp. 2201CG5-10]|uniref:NUDIX hydrolase n=1 Tax=Aquimarina callyspongiae TaxID=3098150 RepID=UPI002AB4B1D4|nr:CoA pyrophosphatase [Aquimarina sp. 2201CG5-10]MDY8137403.1 CoA pyrophosphatase [Aquimarina sp. 2201CG5-10]